MSAVNVSHEATGNRLVNSTLLLGVLACCLALPRIVTEPFGVNLPGFPPYLPAGAVLWAPLVAMVVLANGYLASGGLGLLVRLEDTDVAFAACLAIWLLVEFTHSVRAAVNPDLDLILQLAWLQLFYLAIRSFHHTADVRRWVTRQSILLITAGCVIQLLALLQIIPSAIAPFEPFRERPEYSFVNQAAFLAAFGVILVYFFSDLRRQSFGWQVLLNGCAIVDLVFLLMSQSRGATVVLGGVIIIGVVVKLAPRLSRKMVGLFAVLAVIGLVALRPDFARLAEFGLYNRAFTEGGGMRLEMIRVGAGTFVDHP